MYAAHIKLQRDTSYEQIEAIRVHLRRKMAERYRKPCILMPIHGEWLHVNIDGLEPHMADWFNACLIFTHVDHQPQFVWWGFTQEFVEWRGAAERAMKASR